MTTTTNAFLGRNPIIKSEFRHQRFVIARGRVGRLWIAMAALLVIPSLLFSIYYAGVVLIAPFKPDVVATFEWNDLRVVLLLVMTVAMYSVVTMVSLALAANSIGREKSGKTWDNLRLTDIGARKIVWGKWYATLRAMLGDHMMVSIVRIGFQGAVIAFLMVYDPTKIATYTVIYVCLVAFTWWYTALDTALTAAFGILSALPDETAGFLAGAGIIGGRIATTVLGLAWMIATIAGMVLGGVALGWVMTVLGTVVYCGVVILVLHIAQDVVG